MTTQTKTRYAKVIALTGLAAILSGCAPSPTMFMSDETQVQDNQRYEVKRVAVFRDTIAYDDVRGIYEITDKETGKTYIGVSGIGITEKGSHSAGKTVVGDER
jgi:hypothetical protein